MICCASLDGCAAEPRSCRFRADGADNQVVSVTVPAGATNALMKVVVEGHPNRGGTVTYTKDQLKGLEVLLLAKAAVGDPAYDSSSDNQVACMESMVADAISKQAARVQAD